MHSGNVGGYAWIPWSKEEEQILIDYYGKIEYAELLNMLPLRRKHNVRKKAEKLGLTTDRQKYTYNHSYFSELTNENCYWAGFIAADGYINIKHDSQQPALVITLQRRDKQHLVKFAAAVEHTKPIEERTHNLGGTEFPQASVRVYGCRQWVSDLEQYFNIVPTKSLILQPPNITKTEHIISFLAGYIDGDGSIMYGTYKWKGNIKQGPLSIRLLGTYEMMVWAKKQIESVVGDTKNSVLKHKGIFTYGLRGARAEQFKSIVLSMGLPTLERKWFKEWSPPKAKETN